MDDGHKYRIMRDVMSNMRESLASDSQTYLDEFKETGKRELIHRAMASAGGAGILGAFMGVMDELDDGTLEAEAVQQMIRQAFDKPKEPIEA